jgi:FAD synthetase
MKTKLLAAVWKLNFLGKKATPERIIREIKCREGDLRERLGVLVEEGLLEKEGDAYTLTSQGRKKLRIVMAGGVFDILHPGHVFFLEKAKEKGDVLVVIVARDTTVTRRKRIPIVPEEQRVEMVAALKPVDIALLGEVDDIYTTVEKIKPDVIALGPDQTHREEEIKEELKRRNLRCEVVRIREYRECKLPSTRSILQRIIELNFPDQRVVKK